MASSMASLATAGFPWESAAPPDAPPPDLSWEGGAGGGPGGGPGGPGGGGGARPKLDDGGGGESEALEREKAGGSSPNDVFLKTCSSSPAWDLVCGEWRNHKSSQFQVNFMCIALNPSYSLKGLYRPYDYGTCDYDTPPSPSPPKDKKRLP